MASGFVSVNFVALETAQVELGRQAAELNREQEDLKRALAPVADMWTGAAHTNYEALLEKLRKAAEAVNADIALLSNLMREANQSQQDNEKYLAGKFGGGV
jgi:WXG100 family type VII secretion target